MALKFNTKVAEKLKLKVRKFWELIPIVAEVVREKLVGEAFFYHYKLDLWQSEYVSLDKLSLNRRAINTFVLILINPLSASVALIYKPVRSIDWFLYEGNTST